ncbi:hypothetical protein L484_024098 [Morus notabilis]|uniref:Uncharacterized protein n=1 Tax=Morus notabilis TaxID=981085 RepID=W9SEE0_9ROSA|nr:hypothetical protein L484_024098 [Morus notabilis]
MFSVKTAYLLELGEQDQCRQQYLERYVEGNIHRRHKIPWWLISVEAAVINVVARRVGSSEARSSLRLVRPVWFMSIWSLLPELLGVSRACSNFWSWEFMALHSSSKTVTSSSSLLVLLRQSGENRGKTSGWFKGSSDVAVRKEISFIATVIRDHDENNIINVTISEARFVDPLVVEAQALRQVSQAGARIKGGGGGVYETKGRLRRIRKRTRPRNGAVLNKCSKTLATNAVYSSISSAILATSIISSL